ncbi:MAG TPA: gliding motility-associated C-terminal domain-containing protein, partial [Bacteroidia bacterium]
ALSVSVTPTNLTCNAQCSGKALLSAAGGTPGYSYAWNTVPIQTASTATGLCAGTFSCTIKDANNCLHTSTVLITQPAAISATATATPAACTSSTGTSFVNVSGGTGAFTYLWIPSSQTSQSATGLIAGNYSVSVTDANNCSKTQTVIVTSVNTLSVNASSTASGCTIQNGTATAISGNGLSPYSYSWNNGATTSSISGLATGTYTVNTTDGNGCTASAITTVATISSPTAAATATPVSITLGGNTQLNGSGGGTYLWSPATGLNCSSCANPVATPTATTNYCILVTDANGCTDSSCVTVNVEIPCGEIFIPNAFSPNDDGANDMHCVMGRCITSFHISIYNRLGEKVFESDDQHNCWDGKYRGEMENSAVFVYYMTATLTNGQKINRKGNISLIR